MSEARRGTELSVMNPKSRITVTGPLDHAPRSLVNVARGQGIAVEIALVGNVVTRVLHPLDHVVDVERIVSESVFAGNQGSPFADRDRLVLGMSETRRGG